MPENTRSLEERLRMWAAGVDGGHADDTREAANALAAKDKLLVEAMKALERAIPALEHIQIMTPGGPRRSLALTNLNNARTTLANLKAEMEGK